MLLTVEKVIFVCLGLWEDEIILHNYFLKVISSLVRKSRRKENIVLNDLAYLLQ